VPSTVLPQTGPEEIAASFEPTGSPALPARLGRYRIIAQLGAGGFGIVYKGYDDELQREVAIKVPRAERLASAGRAEAYRNEAIILASLDHPHIVPVYGVGQSEDGLCFVVSKFIDGTDLARRRPSLTRRASSPHLPAKERPSLTRRASSPHKPTAKDLLRKPEA
jgi:serine/threonine protein kinase